MKYIVFCKPSCPYCVQAVKLLEDKNKNFKIVNFNDDQSQVLQEIKTALEWPTVPIIFSKDESVLNFVGGYTDLIKQIEDE
tara:strand:+ start:2439 stop:2681 length:243 start_codon:yes stop_codon:yes gene_type:complete